MCILANMTDTPAVHKSYDNISNFRWYSHIDAHKCIMWQTKRIPTVIILIQWLLCRQRKARWSWVREWLSLTAFIGQRCLCNPYKPCNYSLYIGIFIFINTVNPWSTGYSNLRKIDIKRNTKKWEHPLSWFTIGDINYISLQSALIT